MSAFGRARTWLRNVVGSRRSEQEMQNEMNAHIEQSVERLMSRGISESDARREARLEFGNPAVIQESARDARGGRWVSSLRKDMKFALRYFARTKLTTAAILFTLTLGIGITASMVSIGAAMMLRPAPGVPDDNSLVLVRGNQVDSRGGSRRRFSWPEVEAYSQLNKTFADFAAWKPSDIVIDFGDGESGAQTARVHFVTPNYFRTLGLNLVGGSGFVQSEFGDNSPELTTIISNRLAVQKFGSVNAAVGRTLKANGVNVTIVGVAPARFNGALQSSAPRMIWMPVSALRVVDAGPADVFSNRDSSYFRAIGRLQPGVSQSSASQQVRNVALRAQIGLTPDRQRIAFASEVVALRGIPDNDQSPSDVRIAVTIFGTLLVLILLVCTTTVSSLLVGLGVSRRHEIAIRRSLGASRARIVSQLLTEISLLAMTAASLGLIAYAVICRVLSQQVVDVDISPSAATALGTVLYAILVATVCGLSPALNATRADLSGVLKDASAGSTAKSRLQRIFVVSQIAFSQPLLLGVAIATVLAAREVTTSANELTVDRLVVAELDVWANYDPQRNAAMLGELLPALNGLPGVVAALPTSRGVGLFSLEPKVDNDAGSAASPLSTFRVQSSPTPPRYFERVGVAIARGREFTDADVNSPVPRIMLSTETASKLFGASNPIGRHVYRLRADRRDQELEVVGVVAQQPDNAFSNSTTLNVYEPLSLTEKTTIVTSVVIRTVGPAEPLLSTFRAVIAQHAPRVPIRSVQTFAQIQREERAELLQSSALAAGAGILTLLLGAIGLYAVVALGVAQRRREIGIRIALGAHPTQVVRLFFSSGVRLSLVGMFIGLPLSAGAVWVVSNVTGIMRINLPLISTGIATAVVVIASVATWLPARRAAGVDPLTALRAE